jgi:hypothetical protein
MGFIYKYAKEPEVGLFRNGSFVDLPANMVQKVDSSVISVGKPAVSEAVALMSGNQLNALIAKIDSIWYSEISTPISRMVAAGIVDAVTLVRIVTQFAQGGSFFAGILATGQEVDVWPLRPKDVGGVFLNGAGAVAAGGLYGGVSAAVFSWLNAGVVAGVASTIIPQQTTSGTSPYGGLIIFGGIEKTYTPKIESIQFFLQGATNIVTPQPCAMTAKRTFGDDNDISVFKLEKPIMILPNTSFRVDIMPNVSGATNFELIGMMCGQVQSKAF